jgi:hypothetical protein
MFTILFFPKQERDLKKKSDTLWGLIWMDAIATLLVAGLL